MARVKIVFTNGKVEYVKTLLSLDAEEAVKQFRSGEPRIIIESGVGKKTVIDAYRVALISAER